MAATVTAGPARGIATRRLYAARVIEREGNLWVL